MKGKCWGMVDWLGVSLEEGTFIGLRRVAAPSPGTWQHPWVKKERWQGCLRVPRAAGHVRGVGMGAGL